MMSGQELLEKKEWAFPERVELSDERLGLLEAKYQYPYIEDDMDYTHKYSIELTEDSFSSCTVEVVDVGAGTGEAVDASFVAIGKYCYNDEEFSMLGSRGVIFNKIAAELKSGGAGGVIGELAGVFADKISVKKDYKDVVPKFIAMFMPAYHLVHFGAGDVSLYGLVDLNRPSSLPFDIFMQMPLLS
jgi:hypothetical protein